MADGSAASGANGDSDICAGIDKEMLGLFDALAQYQQMRGGANQELKQAFFDLALSRRSAGYRWISPDLYSGRAQAIATVAADPGTGQLSIVRRDVARRRRAGEKRSQQQSEGPTQAAAEEQAQGLRQRRGKRGGAGIDKEPGKENNGESDEERVPDDPLLWFGMLVPPSLKDAQRGFASSLDLLVALAQAKRQILAKQHSLQQRIAETQQKRQPQGAE